MGIYNTFGQKGVQLKVGKLQMAHYDIGNYVDKIKDGTYLAPDGAVTICGGKVVAIFDKVHDKWGNELDLHEIVEKNNPIGIVVKELSKKHVKVRIGETKKLRRP